VPLLRVGAVVRAVGLKGFLGVGGSSGGLARATHVVLRRGGRDEDYKVLEARPQGRVWALRVEGISDRDAAEAAVGSEVLADRAELGEAEAGSHYWSDLIGLPVVTVTGVAVGEVTGLYETGAVDVLVVTGPRGETLIPLAPYTQVDLEAKRIVVDPPEGLIGGAGGEAED
jgi:16S rRNA processing protein RimM